MTGTQLRNDGMARVASHNPRWEALALQEIKWLRSARLVHKPSETFLFETLLDELEGVYGKIPNAALAGSLAKKAIEAGYIEKTGVWLQTKGEEKHAREARQYRWKPN